MRKTKGLRIAYDTQDTLYETLTRLRAEFAQPTHPKLSTADTHAIDELAQAICAVQERIRIHRGRPLPGTVGRVKPKVKGSAGKVAGRVPGGSGSAPARAGGDGTPGEMDGGLVEGEATSGTGPEPIE